MAKEILELEVKSNIGEVVEDTKDLTNEASNAAGEFAVMGVSLNGVKKGFASATVTAKGMFGSIKAGLISTGIGAFVVVIGSLVAYFTQTEKGAEKLKVILAGIGAAFKVLIDRVSTVGEALTNVFNQSFLTTLKQIGNAFKGINTEIKDEVKLTVDLTERTNELVDAERKLNVETAQKRAKIEELKLIAEDVTKSEVQRLVAAQTAFRLENELLNKRVANAKEAVTIQKELNSIQKVGEADLDALAEKEIALANIKAESATKLIELNNKINAINAETQAKADAFEALQIAQADAFKKRVDDELLLVQQRQQAYAGLAGSLSVLAGDNKELAAASAIIDTYAGANKAFAQGGTIGFVTGAAIIAAGLANVQKIYDTPVGDSGGGGSATTPATPAPQMMSGAFDISGGVAPEAMKAFVVTDEMSSSQNQLANIRRRATI
jgi:hypothetical protein